MSRGLRVCHPPAFFNANDGHGNSFIVGTQQYAGNTPRARLAILVHEFGHMSSIPGYQDDNGDQKKVEANDALVNANCKSLIEGPVILSFTPAATEATGVQIQIVGYNFGGSQEHGTVTFTGMNNSTVVARVTNWTDTALTTTVPVGAVSGPVVVTVNGAISGGKAVVSNGLAFNVSQ